MNLRDFIRQERPGRTGRVAKWCDRCRRTHSRDVDCALVATGHDTLCHESIRKTVEQRHRDRTRA